MGRETHEYARKATDDLYGAERKIWQNIYRLDADRRIALQPQILPLAEAVIVEVPDESMAMDVRHLDALDFNNRTATEEKLKAFYDSAVTCATLKEKLADNPRDAKYKHYRCCYRGVVSCEQYRGFVHRAASLKCNVVDMKHDENMQRLETTIYDKLGEFLFDSDGVHLHADEYSGKVDVYLMLDNEKWQGDMEAIKNVFKHHTTVGQMIKSTPAPAKHHTNVSHVIKGTTTHSPAKPARGASRQVNAIHGSAPTSLVLGGPT